MPKQTDAPKLLNSAEACAALRISLTKFYELVASGELAVIRIPSPTNRRQELRIEPSEIAAFIERNRVGTPAAASTS
jgi:hypothetical protein